MPPVRRQRESDQTYRNMRPGDMIEIVRFWYLYSHWAICIGDGKVSHFTGDCYACCDTWNVFSNGNCPPCVQARVQHDHFWDVVGGSRARVHNNDSDVNIPFPVDAIIGRAKSRVGEKKYSLVTNNCEHYVNWCRYGQGRSDQITQLTWLTMFIAVIYIILQFIRRFL